MSLTRELQKTLTLILAGGQGERLKPLTSTRAKPAVPFGGAYRIIDFTLSNCIHSGLRRIYVLTQYKALSLEEHIRFGWNFLPRRLEQFIGVRPPHHQGGKWYVGTADAIYQNLDTLREDRARHVLILSGDHIYRMDYGRMLREHLRNHAVLTIGAVKIPQEESRRFGVFECDRDGRIHHFVEKPEQGPEIPGEPGWCHASMGIYLFSMDELIRRLKADAADPESSHDFGRDIIPSMIEEVPVYAHRFRGLRNRECPYWRDVGTLDAYFEANMDLIRPQPQFNLYDRNWPIYTLWHNDPPAKTVLAAGGAHEPRVLDSFLSPGTIVSGARVERSILSPRVVVAEAAEVEDSILMSGVEVGRGARLRRAIVDKWIQIPDGFEIGYDAVADARRFHRTESGIVVVPPHCDIAALLQREKDAAAEAVCEQGGG